MTKGLQSFDGVYVATRPIQIIIFELILDRMCRGRSCLLIVDEFAEAELVFKNIQKYGFWAEAFFFHTREEAFRYLTRSIRFNNLYVPSDIGLKFWLQILSIKVFNIPFKLAVCEEGVGTYRTELYFPVFKRKLLRKLGVGTYFGGCHFTDCIYLFEPDVYKNIFDSDVKLYKLPSSLSDYLHSHIDRYKAYFDASGVFSVYGGHSCAIYLTSYQVDHSFIKNLVVTNEEKQFEVLFVKPHPLMKYSVQAKGIDFVIPNKIPVELCLMELSIIFESVTVFHQGSSAAHYMNFSNVEFRRI